jgi:hypothetical protein
MRHSPVARKGQMTIPEKGRKDLRVKLGDKLQYEVEEIPSYGSCASRDSGHSRGPSPAIREQECLSPKSAKPPLRLCVRADIAFAVGSPASRSVG